jgi:hypothetical protein
MVMDIFNLASGNLLAPGNVLTWNVWVNAPTIVDQKEWKNHAEYWRHSIDTDHGSPDGPGTQPCYYNGKPFKPFGSVEKTEQELIGAYVKEHAPRLAAAFA